MVFILFLSGGCNEQYLSERFCLPPLRPANGGDKCRFFTGHRGHILTSSNGNIFGAYLPFVRGIQRSPADSPLKGQWREALMFPLICAWINGWVNNREDGDFQRHRAHNDVTVIN